MMTTLLEVWLDSLLTKKTYHWLSRGDLKGETVSQITAAQDQVLQTKYHVTKMLQT